MEYQYKGNMHLSRAEYKTISTTGTLVKDGKTYTFDPIGTEYIVPDDRFLHVLRCTYNSLGDNEGLNGVVRVINDVATPYTASTITIDVIKKYAVSASGVVIGQGTPKVIVSGVDASGNLTGVDPFSQNSYASYYVNFSDTTSVTFTDTVIQQ